jgi:hypothetical protein
MAINLAAKYESKTSDLLKARKKSEAFVNDDWSWEGVNAINVYTLTDPDLVDYTPNGASRRCLDCCILQQIETRWICPSL